MDRDDVLYMTNAGDVGPKSIFNEKCVDSNNVGAAVNKIIRSGHVCPADRSAEAGAVQEGVGTVGSPDQTGDAEQPELRL